MILFFLLGWLRHPVSTFAILILNRKISNQNSMHCGAISPWLLKQPWFGQAGSENTYVFYIRKWCATTQLYITSYAAEQMETHTKTLRFILSFRFDNDIEICVYELNSTYRRVYTVVFPDCCIHFLKSIFLYQISKSITF